MNKVINFPLAGKVKFYNSHLQRFKGYDCQLDGKNLHVWQTIVCLECLEPISLNKLCVPAPQPLVDLTQEDLLRILGLHIWKGEIPSLARATYDGGPYLCKHHHAGWLHEHPLPHLSQLLAMPKPHGGLN